jgi:hypothetical protein
MLFPFNLSGIIAELDLFYMFRLSHALVSWGLKGAKYLL